MGRRRAVDLADAISVGSSCPPFSKCLAQEYRNDRNPTVHRPRLVRKCPLIPRYANLARMAYPARAVSSGGLRSDLSGGDNRTAIGRYPSFYQSVVPFRYPLHITATVNLMTAFDLPTVAQKDYHSDAK